MEWQVNYSYHCVYLNMKNPYKCRPHNNIAERVCTFANCQDRLMCLLCDHDHVFLPTIHQRLWLDYNKFCKKIDAAIDELLSQTIHAQDLKEIKEQREAVEHYFQQCVKAIVEVINAKKKSILKELENKEDDTISKLRQVRMSRNYAKVDQSMFDFLMMLFEGGTLQEKYSAENAKQVFKAQEMLASTADTLREAFSKLQTKNIRLPKIPQLSSISSLSKQPSKQTEQDEFMGSGHEITDAHQCGQSRVSFESVITDVISSRELLFSTCYDKKLRIISKDLFLLKQIQFGNTLQRLVALSQKQYAVAVSKQVHILNISNDEHMNHKELMKLRSHENKIISLDMYNTRIIGSCSSECVKIWDLYKENEQYSIRQKSNPIQIKFLQNNKQVVIGSLDWFLKYYNVQTLKRVRSFQLKGIPLCIEKFNDNGVYVGGFPNTLAIIDSRAPEPINLVIGTQALTCIHNLASGDLAVGNNSGDVTIFDIRNQKERLNFHAHDGKTNWNKPNGVVKIFSENNFLTTVGANDKKLKKWNIV